MLALRDLDRGDAVIGGQDMEVFARELGLEQLHVDVDVIDNEDSGGHGSGFALISRWGCSQAQNRATVWRKFATEIGLAI